MAGASSAGAGRGAAAIAECGGAALNGALFEVLKIGAAAVANFESPGLGVSEEDDDEGDAAQAQGCNTQTCVILADNIMLPAEQERLVRIEMASAAVGKSFFSIIEEIIIIRKSRI